MDYSYNEHGELETETEARGVVVTRVVDELDRVTLVDYPDTAESKRSVQTSNRPEVQLRTVGSKTEFQLL